MIDLARRPVAGFIAASLLTSSGAAAQDAPRSPPPAAPGAGSLTAPAADGPTTPQRAAPKDGIRFRGGVRGQGGALVAPDAGESLTAVGIQGDLGVQVDDLLGIYAAPSFDIIFGDLGGVNLGVAVLADFTFDDLIQIGAGPDIGAFAALGGSASGISGAGGSLYGGRLHFAAIPFVGDGDDGIRRKALVLGADLRILVGNVGFGTASTSGTSASASSVIVSPIAFIGYEAF